MIMNDFNWHVEAQKLWDDNADFWNQNSQEMWDTGSRSSIIPFMKQYIEEGASILDIGCGDGYGTYKLSLAGYKACGMDISEEMVQIAKQRGENETLSFIQADLVSLPFADEAFDGVLAVNSLEWIKQPSRGLEEIKRVLNPNGSACVAILGPTAKPRESSYRRLYGEDVVCNTMMPWEFEQLAKENGFTITDGIGVYKRGVTDEHIEHLSTELKQALAFLWVFVIHKS
ncbi:class I SAM-dependent methyltransferase [Microbacteriaceae bacterium 4G12]